jgi:ribosomal protein S6
MKKTTVDASRESKVYEVGYLLVPTISPEHLAKEVDALKAVIEKAGAKFISEEAPKSRSLAYKMVKVVGAKRHTFDTAYFGWVKFELTSDKVQSIDKAFKESAKVIRHLLITTVAENTIYGPKVLKEKVEEKPKDAPIIAPTADISLEEIDKAVEKIIEG